MNTKEGAGSATDLQSAILDKLTQIDAKLRNLELVTEQVPVLVSMLTDSVDEAMIEANSGPVTLQDRVTRGMHLINRLSDPVLMDRMEELISFLEKGPGLIAMMADSADEWLQKNPVPIDDWTELIHKFNKAIALSKSSTDEHVTGIFSLMRMLKDEDRRKALSFFMNHLKNFGKQL